MGLLLLLFLGLGMLARLILLMLLFSLSGCYSSPPKSAVIVVEKSRHLENINQQRLATEQPSNQARQTTDTATEQISQIKAQNQQRKKSNQRSSWRAPVTAKVSKTFSKNHQGLTFNTQFGQDIRAIRDGKVIYIGDKMKSHGTMIIIRHPLGFYSTYTQSQSLLVAQGDQIKKNQVIAHTNSQPFYFEMKKFKQTINPLKYLK
ncbi:MAG: M23 family metallopeptidase [Proteobacteria bacterium]|nr:M23 family metallopeptidase [Pseudomonadota bacterium]MCH9712477.1 M23 family metallopeptidase [Pseudomonadota bacterium]MCH9749573.1 M23 family metallopeptidase [Pseudomonadota bacterium]